MAILALGLPPDLLHVSSLEKSLLWYGIPREALGLKSTNLFVAVEGDS